MSQKNRTALKNYFRTGRKPTQEQFADLIDSNLNLEDDGIFDAGGKLGLGHESPASRLSVNGNVSVSPNNDSAPDNGLFVYGKVGIGAGFTGPAAQLAVKGSAYIGNTANTDPGANNLQVDGDITAGGDLSASGALHAAGDATLNGNLTLANGRYVETDKVQARGGNGLKLYEDGGKGLIIQDGSGDVSAGGNLTLANGRYVETDKVQARGGNGLKLYEDGGRGLIIQDGSGDVSAGGNLTLANGKYVETDKVQARGGNGLKLYEDGGRGLIIQDGSGDVSAGGNLTLASNKYVETDQVRARGGSGLKLYDDGGKGLFIQSGYGNVYAGGNLTFESGKYVETDKVRARDSSGLRLHEDGGKGILIHDSTGDVTADGNLTLGGTLDAAGLVTARNGLHLQQNLTADIQTSGAPIFLKIYYDLANSTSGHDTGVSKNDYLAIIAGYHLQSADVNEIGRHHWRIEMNQGNTNWEIHTDWGLHDTPGAPWIVRVLFISKLLTGGHTNYI